MASDPQNPDPLILYGPKGAANMTGLKVLCGGDGLDTLASLLMPSEPLHRGQGKLGAS